MLFRLFLKALTYVALTAVTIKALDWLRIKVQMIGLDDKYERLTR